MSRQTTARAAGYTRTVTCRAPQQRVFDAIATLEGVRGWWTPIVTGSARGGETLAFGFEGLDETIVMRVEETTPATRVRWTCLEHTSAPGWAGTAITFELSATAADTCTLTFRHTGIAATNVADGWDRFVASLTRLAETGVGDPYRATFNGALEVACAYHAAWTSKDFDTARRYLAPDLHTDVPLNTYTCRDDFADAVAHFGRLATRVDLVDELGSGSQALLVYDMHGLPFGSLRVAELFTVSDGLIRHIRHVHDTAALAAVSPAEMTRQASFEAIADQLLGEPGVTEGTGFGASPGLRCDGRIFAMLVRDQLVVKLPARRCTELVSTGTAQPFDRGQGRPLKEWVAISDCMEWTALARESLAFARARPDRKAGTGR